MDRRRRSTFDRDRRTIRRPRRPMDFYFVVFRRFASSVSLLLIVFVSFQPNRSIYLCLQRYMQLENRRLDRLFVRFAFNSTLSDLISLRLDRRTKTNESKSKSSSRCVARETFCRWTEWLINSISVCPKFVASGGESTRRFDVDPGPKTKIRFDGFYASNIDRLSLFQDAPWICRSNQTPKQDWLELRRQSARRSFVD